MKTENQPATQPMLHLVCVFEVMSLLLWFVQSSVDIDFTIIIKLIILAKQFDTASGNYSNWYCILDVCERQQCQNVSKFVQPFCYATTDGARQLNLEYMLAYIFGYI